MIIGYSDHTKPDPEYAVLKTAYNLGAIVIEKHFTLNKKLKGNDHYHAMDPADLSKIKKDLKILSYFEEKRVLDVWRVKERHV